MITRFKIYENLKYDSIYQEVKKFQKDKNSYNKLKEDIEPIAKFIYKDIWDTYGNNTVFLIEEIDDYRYLNLKDISISYNNNISLYYEFILEYNIECDDKKKEYYIELKKEEFEKYLNKYKIYKESEKYNL